MVKSTARGHCWGQLVDFSVAYNVGYRGYEFTSGTIITTVEPWLSRPLDHGHLDMCPINIWRGIANLPYTTTHLTRRNIWETARASGQAWVGWRKCEGERRLLPITSLQLAGVVIGGVMEAEPPNPYTDHGSETLPEAWKKRDRDGWGTR